MSRQPAFGVHFLAIYVVLFLFVVPSAAEPGPERDYQAKLEASFAKTLSGATLDGRYSSTGPNADPSKLAHDKYTLGEVRKLNGNQWLIQARIQYAEHDITLPIIVPVHWAGDTPVIAVDDLAIPPFGTVSARVMFFDGHYAGYWSHGKQGGHLFGMIRRSENAPGARPTTEKSAPASRTDASAREQENQ